jgi:hypothetical protein
MKNTIVTDVTGTEALKLIKEGVQLRCPKCGSMIKTIPDNWSADMPLYGIQCPQNPNHFMIHCEDAVTMKEMRSRMKARANKS